MGGGGVNEIKIMTKYGFFTTFQLVGWLVGRCQIILIYIYIYPSPCGHYRLV